MTEPLEILTPDMMAVPKVLNDLKFETCEEAAVVYSLIFSAGVSGLALADTAGYRAGMASLKAKGVLSVKGGQVCLNLAPLQPDDDDETEAAG